MQESHLLQFSRVGQLVSLQIDQSEPCTRVLGEGSCSLQDLSNSLVTSSSRKRTIKKFRRQCSAGCFMMMSILRLV